MNHVQVQQSWDNAIKNISLFSDLKPIVAESKQIAELSKKFVMINVEVISARKLSPWITSIATEKLLGRKGA